MQISKSEYIMYLKHPAWLWLKKHDKTKLPPIDDNTQAIFDAGNMFEAYAEKLFPDGLRLGFDNYEEYLTLPQATAKAIADGNKTLFQARFEADNITCICDVVQFVDDKTLDLFEIKSSTKAKPEHELDLAFQMTVLERAGYSVRKISVVHVNNQYIRSGAIDPKELTGSTDVTEAVRRLEDFTNQKIAEAVEMLESGNHPDFSPTLAEKSAFGEWLEIYKHLNSFEAGSIYDLCQLDSKTLSNLNNAGIEFIKDIPENFILKPKQALQVEATRLERPIIHTDKIKEFFDSFVFPLYFFDYETLASLVPYFDGLRPYQQLPFQYSLHVLESPNSELKHYEYLHRENSNPALSLSETLKSHIGDQGSVITWNMGFEKSCNTLLGSLLPEFTSFYESLNERIVDLMIPFSNGMYIDKDFCGSASIKNVLPVLVPELSYKALGIQEGASAQRLWMEAVLDGKRDEQKQQILDDLVEYCKLDTLAMVEIYKKLVGVVREH